MQAMRDYCNICCLFFFLLLYTDDAYSQIRHYIIIPSLNDLCPQESSCCTLSQFATIFYSYGENESDLTLFFLPGNHHLEKELLLAHRDNVTMKKSVECNDSAVYVECVGLSARFVINDTVFALIENLHFIGCGGNKVNRVKQLVMVNATFQGVNPTLSAGGVIYAAFSNVLIVGGKFTHNTAKVGGVLFVCNGTLHITRSTFSCNRADCGGVMVTSQSSVIIYNSTFSRNRAERGGGVIESHYDSISVISSTFADNRAKFGGVMKTFDGSLVGLFNSIFTNNCATSKGGVLVSMGSSCSIMHNTFGNNSAIYGGVVAASKSSLQVNNSTFTNNSAINGGVVASTQPHNNSFNIVGSVFINNRATSYGGVIRVIHESSTKITNCLFVNNRATNGGVVMTRTKCNIAHTNFTGNRATYGGAIRIEGGTSSAKIISSIFTGNSASEVGGVIICFYGSLNLYSSRLYLNDVSAHKGVLYSVKCSIVISKCKFDSNAGSLYAFNSNVNISGRTSFHNNKVTHQEGGAITSFQSTVMFRGRGVSSLSNNQARHGGAILATESTIVMVGKTLIAENKASNGSGGGISLRQSVLKIIRDCTISHNYALRGGGVHATSSIVSVYDSAILKISNNNATNGSGIYLQISSKINLLKNMNEQNIILNFTGNLAKYGGALFVADDTNSGACLHNIECFIQTLASYQKFKVADHYNFGSVTFSGNNATEQGPAVYGGFLDRCIPSPFAEVHLKRKMQYSGITYFQTISNIALDYITSQPVRVCFCSTVGQPNCSYQPPPIKVKKGETFTVSLVALDQVNHVVGANILSYLSSSDGGFDEGQQTQPVHKSCSNIMFNVFSPQESETIFLHPDGPCGRVPLSTNHVTVQFLDCTCPIGFEPRSVDHSATRCECICDSRMSSYVTNCNSTSSSILRVNTNSWIAYISDTKPPGYIIHPNCPSDYCQPSDKNVSINFNVPGGSDAQCSYSRTGVLCGACQSNLSLSLGSSQCLSCDSHWPVVFVVIVTAAILCGILLVVAVLALNITVAVGLINGFIFYANIVAASTGTFFPSSKPHFPSVFVAWLNLDVGFDVCFFDGLDTYTQTWVQLAFPLYIISLVFIIIQVSKYSTRFVRLIGKSRDPIATLATLILLSYAKLLSVTITALSPAVLHYPDGTYQYVWLPDGNVQYLQGKHIPLFLVALLIIIIGIPYTILLLLWQWLIIASNWRILKWTRNTKLNAFIDTYHAPYNNRHRYWTGLLLLVRVILYVTSSVTESSKPQTLPLMAIICVGGLIILSKIIGHTRVYNNTLVDVVNTLLYFNLLALAAFSLYDFKSDMKKQTAVAYTSTIITFTLLVGAVIYHVRLLIKCTNFNTSGLQELNEYLVAPVQSLKAEATQSIIEFPSHDCSHSELEDDVPRTIETETTIVAYQ